jgi:2-oxoglutarate ferredoxin oxidoreductase subunit alpha
LPRSLQGCLNINYGVMDVLKDLTWKVGGAQGEGIDSTGEIFSSTLNRMGYYVFAYRHFMSLIKGGHTNYKVRVSDQPVHYHGDSLDVFIVFDQRSIDENLHELGDGSIIIYDPKDLDAKVPEGFNIKLCPVPMSEIAKDVGNVIMKNMVACGASAAIVGLPLDGFDSVVQDRFGKKGENIIKSNKEALQRGFDYCMEHYGQLKKLPPRPGTQGHYFISGNEAIGVGTLMAGCRLLAQYPITPATEVMYWLIANMPKYGGKIIQAEDEIAACIMAIGANYAGARAMTATSGPGFSLMMEALGFAGISETPLVIVDVQRGGPSTGLPTKVEQSDLNEMLYGSHGESPRIVLIPSTIKECYEFMARAFNLAEQYQCPVIVGSDLFLGMSKQSIATDKIDVNLIPIDRGARISDEELAELEKGAYKRFKITDSGISPRAIPGQKNGIFVSTSNEHDENRYEIEDPETRNAMMKKRDRKLSTFDSSDWGVEFNGSGKEEIILVGFGSTYAQLSEARQALQAAGVEVGHLHLKALMPFPDDQVKALLQSAHRILVIENNFTGQAAQLVRQRVGMHDRIHQLNKFDGNPLTVKEIVNETKKLQGVTV